MPTTVLKNTVYKCLLPFLAPGCGSSPVTGISGHAVIHARSFVSLLKKHHVLGSATLVSSGNQLSVIYSASEQPRHLAGENTYFRVASITKVATSVLVKHLADRNMLDLDAPVTQYLPVSAAETGLEGTTLRHLLSHTSGLADPADLEASLEKGIPFPEVTKRSRFSAPGSSFRYSNLGFGLIGCVLEYVLKKPVGLIFEEHLFQPLKMNAANCLRS